MANLKSTTISDTGFLQLPSGTTGQRPQSPTAGEIRFNTDTKVTEWYDEELDAWFPTGVVPPVATGGDTVEDVDIDGVTYRIHSFTSVGESTFTVTRGGPVDYLIVAGGGSGGISGYAGGGGAGGLLTGSTNILPGAFTLVVGNGATGVGENGENSTFFNKTAFGGGGGGGNNNGNPTVGGSGGGGRSSGGESGASGTPGQGNKGGNGGASRNGGGGGGAGEAGKVSDGGDGVSLQITGSSKFYSGGGGGNNLSDPGIGGLGGGGSDPDSGQSADGEPNTGGGSGTEAPGNGGSGIVIIRYRIS